MRSFGSLETPRARLWPRPSESATTHSGTATGVPARPAHVLCGLRALQRPRATQYLTGVSAEASQGAERHIRFTARIVRCAAARRLKKLQIDHNQRPKWSALLRKRQSSCGELDAAFLTTSAGALTPESSRTSRAFGMIVWREENDTVFYH